MNHNKMLVLAPHTDDGELGCGGMISKSISEGIEVYYAAFSLAEESVPEGWPKDILFKEVNAATQSLGIPTDHLLIYKYPVRRFTYHRQEILEDLVAISRNIKPDLVLMPTEWDLHQDHQIIAAEGLRAFKTVSILGYELPWNNITFETSAFVHLSDEHIRNKVEALKCYQSQSHRRYCNEEFIRGLAITRGVQIGVQFAEAFKVKRWII
ncbi:PIG-L family deacetylase [candidate division KSB1 bacterium]|nr:PIG-L family deacetylase [candidate division KSB1 bacterium]